MTRGGWFSYLMFPCLVEGLSKSSGCWTPGREFILRHELHVLACEAEEALKSIGYLSIQVQETRT